MNNELEGTFWFTEAHCSVQLLYQAEQRRQIKEIFTDWLLAAEGYDKQNDREIIIYKKSFQNKIELREFFRFNKLTNFKEVK